MHIPCSSNHSFYFEFSLCYSIKLQRQSCRQLELPSSFLTEWRQEDLMPYRLDETAGRCFENKPHLSSSDTPYVELLLPWFLPTLVSSHFFFQYYQTQSCRDSSIHTSQAAVENKFSAQKGCQKILVQKKKWRRKANSCNHDRELISIIHKGHPQIQKKNSIKMGKIYQQEDHREERTDFLARN